MSIVAKLIAVYPALAKGDAVEDPAAVKRLEQVNSAIRTLLAAAVTLAVVLGWLPKETDVQQVVMVASGIYVALSSAYTFVSAIVTTRKLGLEPPK
jgi:hypothetical protein